MKISAQQYKLIFIAYIIIVLFLSVYPTPEGIKTGYDKINHATAFVVFTFLLTAAWKDLKPVPTFLWGLGFGILIEFIQYFLPYRSAEFLDVAADAAGILIALIMLRIIRKQSKPE